MVFVPSIEKVLPRFETFPNTTGMQAEEWVANRYRQQGWEILAQNYRRRATELDLVAWKQGTLAFVEVKARKQLSPPSEIVRALLPPTKQAALQRGAMIFIQEMEGRLFWRQARFDLVVLVLSRKDPVGFLFFPDAWEMK